MNRYLPSSERLEVNAAQASAVAAFREHRRLAVDAMPGTGKTFLSVQLAIEAARNGWVDRRRPALLMTFSKAARVQLEAQVTKFRVEGWMTPDDERAIEVTNFHAFFLHHVQARRGLWGVADVLRPATPSEHEQRVLGLLPKPRRRPFRRGTYGSRWQNWAERGLGVALLPDACPDCPPVGPEWPGKESVLRAARGWLLCGRPSYADLAPLMLDLLRLQPSYALYLRARHPLFVVDEFQDTDDLQYEVLRAIAPAGLVLLYDRHQMIYGFLGAREERIETALNDFGIPSGSRHELRDSQRLAPGTRGLADILTRVRAHLSGGPPPQLRAAQGVAVDTICPKSDAGGSSIDAFWGTVAWRVHSGSRDSAASTGVLLFRNRDVTTVSRLLRSGTGRGAGGRSPRPPRSCRSLMGSQDAPHESVRTWLEQLRQASGYVTLDLILQGLLLALDASPLQGTARVDLQREFTRGTRPFLRKKLQVLRDASTLWEGLDEVLDHGGWLSVVWTLERVSNTAELLGGGGPVPKYAEGERERLKRPDWDAVAYLRTLAAAAKGLRPDMNWGDGFDALEAALLRASYLRLRQPQRGISVMTVHQAKGREFDQVILPWAVTEYGDDDGRPTPRAPMDARSSPEDLRVLYVALTRARRRVQILVPGGMDPGILRAWGLA